MRDVSFRRNPDPSAVQFRTVPGQTPPRGRPPPSPQAQLQQLYFNRQFQQQIPLRPRLLRPLPRPAEPSSQGFPGLTSTSQVHDVHEARLRASLAGSDPNLAVQSLIQQQGTLVGGNYDQQLSQLATALQEQTQLQAVPQQVAQVQSVPQQQGAYTISSQVRYVPEPQQVSQRPVPYSSRQVTPPQQLVSSEQVKPSRRPAPAEQYLRETSQPLSGQTVVQIPQGEQSSQPTVYLSSQSGQQAPSTTQDDDIISQLLSQQGRGLIPSSTPSSVSLAEELINPSTSSPPTEPRSSIFVTKTSNVKKPQSQGRITLEELRPIQDNSDTTLPIVHLPTPKGQRPLTQTEFQALIDAGFKISPVPESPVQTVTSGYYQPTTKRQRSYATPSPTQRNQVSHQSRQKKPQREKDDVQQISSPGPERLPQREQVNRYQPQETKPRREEEDGLQYVRNPEAKNIRQGLPVTRIQVVTNKPQPEEEIIHFIQIPTTPEVPDVQQRGDLTKYQPDAERQVVQTQDRRLQQPQQERYQTQSDSLPQQPTFFNHDEEPVSQQALRFHPIIVAELPTTATPRRRRPRPGNSGAVYRAQLANEQRGSQDAPEQYLVSYDSIPEATSFGTRGSRPRSRRPISDEES